jgi:ATP-dependent DNA helicase replicase
VTPVNDNHEIRHAEKTIALVKQCIEKELTHLKLRRENILEERKYFNDYFNELKEDEKKDLLDNELLDTNAYVYSLQFLARLGKQLKEPYFAGFVFKETREEDNPEAAEAYYLSIHTLRDPVTNEIITTDWRAPIASLYYESEPGDTYFAAPVGKISGTLLHKRRYVFRDGILVRYSEIGMPSDDEVLCEVLSQNSDTHMKTILQTLQKEQYKIVRDYIEGISVIQGCAGSGKSSIALHKAAYVLYAFREKLKDSSMTVISPNSVFSEYISSVLPDLGEENIERILPEDVIYEVLKEVEGYRFMERLTQQEMIRTEVPESGGCERLASFKATMRFRDFVMEYIKWLRSNIFQPEDLYLDEELGTKVEAALLKDLFYSQYSDLAIMNRTAAIAKYIGEHYAIKKQETLEKIRMELNYMMRSLSVPALYRMMYVEFPEIADYAPGQDSWEDACAVAVLYLMLYEPETAGRKFYLIADEAQDFIPIYLELLRHVYQGANMLFVGDHNQKVFGNEGDYVSDIKKIIRRRPFRTYRLDTNYRSTRQIIEYASRYLKNQDTIRCVREGNTPLEAEACFPEEVGAAAKDYILRMVEKGYENIALICRSAAAASQIEPKIGLEYSVLSKINFRVLPLYLAKGLEYDCAILWDIPEELMYTACTRAMHELFVIRKGETD